MHLLNRWLLSTVLFVVVVVIYTLSALPKLLKWIWFDDVTLLILLILLFRVGLFILLLLAFNLNLFVLELVLLLPTPPPPPPPPIAPLAANNGVVADGTVGGVKWYAEFCTDVQLPSSFDLINSGCSIFRPLSQPPKFILSHRPLFGKRFRLDVPANQIETRKKKKRRKINVNILIWKVLMIKGKRNWYYWSFDRKSKTFRFIRLTQKSMFFSSFEVRK